MPDGAISFEISDVETPTTAVVEAIAEHKGIDPMNLEPPLYEVIATDAMDTLLTRSGSSGAAPDVTFAYEDIVVQVDGNWRISLSPLS